MLRVEEGFQGNGLAQSYRHEARKPCLYLLRKHEQQQMIMIIIPTVIIINAKLNQHGNKKR
jgi:hypothetical protein